jgi:hypothetical protein
MTAKLIHAQECKETIARRRSPLSKEMYVAMAKLANTSDQDSAELVTFDWFYIIKYTGFRVAEYAQEPNPRLMSSNMHQATRLLRPSLQAIGNSTMRMDAS